MRGTIHNIHKLNNSWIFKTYEKVGKDLIPKRIPFITLDKSYTDGQEIEVVISNDGLVEIAREKN
jgi:hypothetical protein